MAIAEIRVINRTWYEHLDLGEHVPSQAVQRAEYQMQVRKAGSDTWEVIEAIQEELGQKDSLWINKGSVT